MKRIPYTPSSSSDEDESYRNEAPLMMKTKSQPLINRLSNIDYNRIHYEAEQEVNSPEFKRSIGNE